MAPSGVLTAEGLLFPPWCAGNSVPGLGSDTPHWEERQEAVCKRRALAGTRGSTAPLTALAGVLSPTRSPAGLQSKKISQLTYQLAPHMRYRNCRAPE